MGCFFNPLIGHTGCHQNHFRSIFIDSSTNRPLTKGQTYARPIFAETLRKIAERGPEDFYFGEIGKNLVDDLKGMGGIVSMEDLKNYR